MDKLKMHSPNITRDNITRIRDLFPGCVTEAKDGSGHVKLAVDFDQLRQELSESVVEGTQERYHLTWPGKREALLAANSPIAKTLRPVRTRQNETSEQVGESVNFDTTKNLFIEGDNLDALKLLQEAYLGKVKLIYIDPPYNTGNDFIYRDDFAQNSEEYLKITNQRTEDSARLVTNPETNGRYHSDWLSMMYSRIRIAWNFLREDGAIFVSIDEHEVINLHKIMTEICGEHNHVATLSIINNMKGRNDRANVATCHEYLLIFSKGQFCSRGLPLTDEQLSEYKYIDTNRQRYALRDLRKRGRPDRREDRPNMFFPIFYDENTKKCHLTRINESQIEITPKRGDGSDGRWRWGKERVAANLANLEPRYSAKKQRWDVDHRVYLNPIATSNSTEGDEEVDDDDKDFERTSKSKSFWWGGEISTDVANREFKKLMPELNPDYPKSPFFIEKILRMSTAEDDIVMDFFAGYGTTAHAVLMLNAEDGGNRRFILVQIPEPVSQDSDAFKLGFRKISDVCIERIRRAGVVTAKATCHTNWRKDIGFRVLKVDSSNMADVYYAPDALEKHNFDMFIDNIKPDRTPEDLLFQVMLDWGVDLSLPITKQVIQGKDVFVVDNNALAACFDRNGGIDEEFVKALAKVQPLRVVFRDAGFKDSSVKINVEQIFKLLSPATEVKCI